MRMGTALTYNKITSLNAKGVAACEGVSLGYAYKLIRQCLNKNQIEKVPGKHPMWVRTTSGNGFACKGRWSHEDHN